MRALGRLVAKRLPIALLGGLAAAIVYLASGARLIGASPIQASLTPSPETSTFLAFYASGDEQAADALASPLYGAEWVRRGVSAAARAALRGASRADGGIATLLRFEYVGGVRSSGGFDHLLYLVRPTRAASGTAGGCSAWRVDADPRGRVVWLELVWLFGQDSADAAAVGDRALAGVPAPAGQLPIAGVRSEATGEGHYFLAPAAASGAVQTFSVDRDGGIRPGAWSYGVGDWSVRAYPPLRSPAGGLRVPPEDQPELDAYLRAIR